MDLLKVAANIKTGETALGIELGSTRIKAVLVNYDCQTIASGSYGWENALRDGVWTYSLDEVWKGIQACYAQLAADVQSRYHVPLTRIGSIGVSAMMHGYLAFDSQGELLVPFRTWRNNITSQAAKALTEAFHFNIPQRWSIAHLYQAILNGEDHVPQISFLTTLAGYVHWKLCGEKVLGIGDASGMFPVDERTGTYDAKMLSLFDELEAVKPYSWKLADLLPKVLRAGEGAGTLTEEGARLLDPAGRLEQGSHMAPPEGDAGTGMVSTNSVRKRTGNISVGTSAFSMNVLDQPLQGVHEDIDVVTTPDGAPVAMVHTNNCSSDINAWVDLFGQFAAATGLAIGPDKLYETLFNLAGTADKDAGGLVNYSYLSGENVTRIDNGRPLFVRTPHSRFTLPNFMLSQLYAAFAPLKIGMDILVQEEGIETDVMIAQGGLFKTPVIGQQVLADALNMPITIMDTAGEGGPWGMAVLAVYMEVRQEGETLADFLDERVFRHPKSVTLTPNAEGVEGCNAFIENYKRALSVEAEAGRTLAE